MLIDKKEYNSEEIMTLQIVDNLGGFLGSEVIGLGCQLV
jgi:hypothetical protein